MIFVSLSFIFVFFRLTSGVEEVMVAESTGGGVASGGVASGVASGVAVEGVAIGGMRLGISSSGKKISVG